MYKENFASFLKKVPKIYCKVQKRNRKLHWVHVHLVRNELSSVHVHFSLQKSDQHPIHECELNGKSSVPSPTMLSYTWLYTDIGALAKKSNVDNALSLVFKIANE